MAASRESAAPRGPTGANGSSAGAPGELGAVGSAPERAGPRRSEQALLSTSRPAQAHASGSVAIRVGMPLWIMPVGPPRDKNFFVPNR
jgi:hypothetical protein